MGDRTETTELRFEDLRRSVAETLHEARLAAEREDLRRAARERVNHLLGRDDDRLDPRTGPHAGNRPTAS